MIAPVLSAFILVTFYLSGLYTVSASVTPVADFQIDYLLGCAFALLGHGVIELLFRRSPVLRLLHWSWVARIVTTLVVSLFYEAHYKGLDSFYYYSAAQGLEEPFLGVGNGTHGMASIVYYIGPILFNSYQALKVVFAFFGMTGLYLFYRSACMMGGESRSLLNFVAFMFFPSLVFWSSILGKDPLIVLGLGVFTYACVRVTLRREMKFLPLLPLALFLLGIMRVWLVSFILVPTTFIFVTSFLGRMPRLRATIFCASVLGALPLAARSFAIDSFGAFVRQIDDFSTGFAFGGSARHYDRFHDIWDVLTFLPTGIFSAIFRPLLGEIDNPFGYLAGLENLGLISLCLCGAMHFRLTQRLKYPALWCLLCVLALAIPYAYVSPFNLGTGFRFRVQILPFLFLALSVLLGASLPNRSRQAMEPSH